MPKIISYPKTPELFQVQEDVIYQDSEQPFGYFETQNSRYRSQQEDALAWETLDETLDGLAPEEIGKRLWTTYRMLDEQVLKEDFEDGTTASTTIYDGKDNLITATLADAASFAAIYHDNGKLLGVVRLNSVTHKPTDPKEKLRIEKAGGFVIFNRVGGTLAISRAIGDKYLKESGVSSEATIDINSIKALAETFNISPEAIEKIQIITTCDGFTDGASEESKVGHEAFLIAALNESITEAKTEAEIAKALVQKALANGSKDNVSVTVQTITKNTPSFLLGVYDGHGGSKAATHVAQNISSEFRKQCALTKEVYQGQALSVEKNQDVYKRDNSQLASQKKIELIKAIVPTVDQVGIDNKASNINNQTTVINQGTTLIVEPEIPEVTELAHETIKEEIDIPTQTDKSPNSQTVDQVGIDNKASNINNQTTVINQGTTLLVEPEVPEVTELAHETIKEETDIPTQTDKSPNNQEECRLIIEKLLQATQKYQTQLSKKNQEIHLIIEQLLTILNSPEQKLTTIKNYFDFLNEKEPGKRFTNMEIIQSNKDISTKRFLAGIAIIAATLITGILPGLAIIGAVYKLTDKSPLDLFKTKGELFKADLEKIRKDYLTDEVEQSAFHM
ncbi:PP2C family serine/threonine-protein phosphatase [Legionella sp. D16C41]|uniref:PP2C family serine/threonine-protein phosphatase n=1 Tax=Legionella sp. D16C41 TaxID=3402688 RepID=UPI003AF870D0